MSLSIILICLLAERFLLEHQDLRQFNWFSDYSNWFERQELPNWMQQGFGGIIILLLPPLLAATLLQQLLNVSLFGIPGTIFAALVLLYSFGPQDLDRQISRFIEAREQGDEEQATSIAKELLHDEPPPHDPSYSQAVAEGVLEQANSRIFAVIFWFLLLGPSGALLYRLATLLPKLQTANRQLDLFHSSKQLLAILDWIPARLTAFAYAVAGSFEDALYGWRSYHEGRMDEFESNASGILICTGTGALRLSTLLDADNAEQSSRHHYLAETAMGLVWRSLVVWLVLLSLFALAGWI
ncbi:MAG: regulatory signaling modulator protein AmpE [Pseudomonadota bacterium]